MTDHFLQVTPEQLKQLQEVANQPRVPEAGNHQHNFIPCLIYFLSLIKPKSIIEIGCYRGISTEAFLIFADKVTVIDPFLDSTIKEEFLKRVEPYKDKLTIIEGYSPKDLKDIPTGSFDMCYVDGDHNFQAVMDDINECKRIVKHGGILAGHDYDVVAQVNAAVILALHGFEPEIFLGDSTWATCNADYRR